MFNLTTELAIQAQVQHRVIGRVSGPVVTLVRDQMAVLVRSRVWDQVGGRLSVQVRYSLDFQAVLVDYV